MWGNNYYYNFDCCSLLFAVCHIIISIISMMITTTATTMMILLFLLLFTTPPLLFFPPFVVFSFPLFCYYEYYCSSALTLFFCSSSPSLAGCVRSQQNTVYWVSFPLFFFLTGCFIVCGSQDSACHQGLSRGGCVLHQNLGRDIHHHRKTFEQALVSIILCAPLLFYHWRMTRMYHISYCGCCHTPHIQ